MTDESPALIDNVEEHRFEMHPPGGTAFLSYRRRRARLFLLHTEVPLSLRGSGIGTKLIRAVLDRAAADGEPIVPFCPFVQKFLRDNPEYSRLVVSPDEPIPPA
jgi:uncharacterized protein